MTTQNGTQHESRIEGLEQSLTFLAWLHAEQAQTVNRLAHALAAMLAQQMQPQMQQAMLAQLTGAQ